MMFLFKNVKTVEDMLAAGCTEPEAHSLQVLYARVTQVRLNFLFLPAGDSTVH